MLSDNQKITLRQLQVLMLLDAFGTGVILLPKRAAQYAAQDGWLPVVGITLAACVSIVLITSISRLFPAASFMAYTRRVFGRPAAYFAAIGLLVKILLSIALQLRIFIAVTRVTLLENTPGPVVGAVLVAVSAYAAVKGMEIRARLGELLVCLVLVPFLVLLVLTAIGADFSNIHPAFTVLPDNLLAGSLGLGFMLTGLECTLLVFPYLTNPGGARRAMIQITLVVGLLFVLVTAVAIAVFGPEDLTRQPWPTLRMMDMAKIPGAFIERKGALIFSIWIISISLVINAALFFSAILLKDVCRKGTHRAYVLAAAIVVFFLSCIPVDAEQAQRLLEWLCATFGVFYLFIFPLLLLIAARMRGFHQSLIRSIAGIVILLSVSFTASGCWDRVEIENRSFAIAISIDRAKEGEGNYTVGLAVPAMDKDKDNAGSEIKKATGGSITEALRKLETQTVKKIYLGQAKMIVLGEGLLGDAALLSGAAEALDTHADIDRQALVLAAKGEAFKVLESPPPDESLPGMFAAQFFRDHEKMNGQTLRLDFKQFNASLASTCSALLPIIRPESEAYISGTAAVQNGSMAGELTGVETRGYLWCVPGACRNAAIMAENQQRPVPITVEKHSARLSFDEINNQLRLTVYVYITGRMKEHTELLAQRNTDLCNHYANTIADEIIAAASHKAYRAEVYGWREALRKKNASLYAKYASDGTHAFEEMLIVPQVTVRLH